MYRSPEMPFIRKHLVFLWLKVKADEILTSDFKLLIDGRVEAISSGSWKATDTQKRDCLILNAW